MNRSASTLTVIISPGPSSLASGRLAIAPPIVPSSARTIIARRLMPGAGLSNRSGEESHPRSVPGGRRNPAVPRNHQGERTCRILNPNPSRPTGLRSQPAGTVRAVWPQPRLKNPQRHRAGDNPPHRPAGRSQQGQLADPGPTAGEETIPATSQCLGVSSRDPEARCLTARTMR